PGTGRLVRLPLYPWQRERFWFESEESRRTRLTAPSHPLLGVTLGAAVPASENRLDLKLFPALAHHRVRRAVVGPATAYVEMLLAVAGEVAGPRVDASGWCVEDIKLTTPGFLTPDAPLRLQTLFHPGESTVQIHSRPCEPVGSAAGWKEGRQDWTAHCSGV